MLQNVPQRGFACVSHSKTGVIPFGKLTQGKAMLVTCQEQAPGLSTADVDLDHLAKVVLCFSGFSTVTFLPSSFTLSSGEGSHCTERGVRAEQPQELFAFLLPCLSLLPHLFRYLIISLCQQGLAGIYYIYWAVIQCCPIFLLQCFQLWPLQALSWLWHPLGIPPSTHTHIVDFSSLYFFFQSIFLLSGMTRCSRLILYVFRPHPRISHFSKELGSFQKQRSKCCVCSLLPGPSVEFQYIIDNCVKTVFNIS